MRIDGVAIAETIYISLKSRVQTLAAKNIIPHVAIILVGDDPASTAYVNQKQKKAEEIGIKSTLFQYPVTVDTKTLLEKVAELNEDTSIHGIIIQRPLPKHINGDQLNQQTVKEKDVDSFRKDSPFPSPLPAAVMKIIETIYNEHVDHIHGFHEWLRSKQIVVIGKGETAGAPITTLLREKAVQPTVIDSQIKDPHLILKRAEIVISAVGKENVITADMLQIGVILISVGIWRGTDGKLHGDYSEDEIKDVAAFYTPIPGGVGPVNVAMLLSNVTKAAESQMTQK